MAVIGQIYEQQKYMYDNWVHSVPDRIENLGSGTRNFGNTVISSTDNLILSNVVGLSQTSAYSNYPFVKASLQSIMCQFLSAVSATIGNLAESGETDKEVDYFWLLNFVANA